MAIAMCSSKAADLRVAAVFAGAEEVESGLADRAHARAAREPVDLGEAASRSPGCRELGSVVGVDRDGGEHARLARRDGGGPLRGRDVGADLHDAADCRRLDARSSCSR